MVFTWYVLWYLFFCTCRAHKLAEKNKQTKTYLAQELGSAEAIELVSYKSSMSNRTFQKVEPPERLGGEHSFKMSGP